MSMRLAAVVRPDKQSPHWVRLLLIGGVLIASACKRFARI
jgi:hypothetical protein